MADAYLQTVALSVQYLREKGYVIPPCDTQTILTNAEIVIKAEEAGEPLPHLEWGL